MQVDRRAFLTSAVAAGALAGCLGGDGGGGTSSGGNKSDAGSAGGATNTAAASEPTTATGTAQTSSSGGSRADSNGSSAISGSPATGTPPAAGIDHPAVAALAGQPFRGPAPGVAPATIVAFEDPSCHNCDRFNANTFPELESKLIEPGKVSFVYRNFPHAFQWGKPAMGALEATLSRQEKAFWALEHHYFAAQEEFSESNVLDLTEEFLATETSVDAAAVVADVEASVFDEAMQRDIDAGENAGVVSTPTFYLFRDEEFLTEIRGAQSYEVFAQALGI